MNLKKIYLDIIMKLTKYEYDHLREYDRLVLEELKEIKEMIRGVYKKIIVDGEEENWRPEKIDSL